MSEIKNLAARLPDQGTPDAEALLEIFVEWSMERGLELYPAQEEAILEVMAGNHVILNTPTGSGKSLVALAMHFKAFAEGRRSVYTSPIKALVNEKFFDLCKHFGAKNVGILTGDASINSQGSVICCTAEVLSAMALTEGRAASVHYAILDEFHYYSDRDRGVAWQIPLLTLPQTTFMLMSATLGDTGRIERALEAKTHKPVSVVTSVDRPVPLDFGYAQEPILETIAEVVRGDKAPVYVVNFTQRECAELAQALTSANISSKEQRQRISGELKGVRFDTPYGDDIKRFINHGVGIHHAGLLPRYRLLIEKLAQSGLLRIICGTDTLGVGINVPLRTVLFSKLCKYDGQKTRLLTVRDFKQIAGRAGRKGFDDQGWVLCQAPEHVIENRRLEMKAMGDPKKRKKLRKKGAPTKGYVHWDEEVYQKLIYSQPEALSSRFNVDHGMVINMLQRSEGLPTKGGGYRALIELIESSHSSDSVKSRLRKKTAHLFKSLARVGVVEVEGRPPKPRVSPELQKDFSMYHTLSLFLIYGLSRMEMEAPEYAKKVLSYVEAILESPNAILYKQENVARRQKNAELKMEGYDYEERQEKLEEITWPQPDGEEIEEAYESFTETRPWAKRDAVQTKSIARDMFERYASFNGYVREVGLERVEGVLLRYITQVYKTLMQAVPDPLKTDELHDLIGYLRATIQRADASLLQTWKAMVDGRPNFIEEEIEGELENELEIDLAEHPKALRARVRAELHSFARALSRNEYGEAISVIKHDDEDEWTADRLLEALKPFYEEFDQVVFNHEARQPMFTQMEATGMRQWKVRQVLCDPLGDNFWYMEGEVDLRGEKDPVGPIVALRDIRS